MRKKTRYDIPGFLLFLFLFGSCVEPFDPEIEIYENILVVDGFITNENRPQEVKLSRSFSYSEYKHYPETGALVSILDDEGGLYELTEVGPGSYYSDTSLFAAESGKQYQLHIILGDGNEYESDWVELKKAPPIEGLEWQFERKETADPNIYNEGIQFYLSSSDLQNSTWYYRWEWDETWEFRVPMRMPGWNRYQCWKSNPSGSIMIESTKHLVSDRVIEYPVHFVSTGSNRLAMMYNLQVKQHAISQAAYEFWKMQEDMGENAGTLFDPIPTAIPGNIYSIGDPDEPVLGYFEASGVTTRRIFINRGQLPSGTSIPNGFDYCKFETLINPSPTILNNMLANGWVYVDEYYNLDSLLVRLTNHGSCLDCTLNGTNVKPSYWPN